MNPLCAYCDGYLVMGDGGVWFCQKCLRLKTQPPVATPPTSTDRRETVENFANNVLPEVRGAMGKDYLTRSDATPPTATPDTGPSDETDCGMCGGTGDGYPDGCQACGGSGTLTVWPAAPTTPPPTATLGECGCGHPANESHICAYWPPSANYVRVVDPAYVPPKVTVTYTDCESCARLRSDVERLQAQGPTPAFTQEELKAILGVMEDSQHEDGWPNAAWDGYDKLKKAVGADRIERSIGEGE